MSMSIHSSRQPPQAGLLVLSHLRWDFVYQRPQHLMTRAARDRAVYYVEEPVFGDWDDHLRHAQDPSGVQVLTPSLRGGPALPEPQSRTAALLKRLVQDEGLDEYDLWIYSPMELPVAAHLSPRLTVYDCMDELANFKGAPPELCGREQELLRRSDLIFTGGHRIYEAKAQQHPQVYAFPSSVDTAHFSRARRALPEPADQAALSRPRLGFAGVIDERLDTPLLGELARRRPEWQFVLLGPVVKIDPASLPQGPNLHYLGMKSYADLPAYLAHWDVALMPFAHNDATRFISPTKTPEYLAAGRPVVSTGIHDVIRSYGAGNLVRIADGVDAFEQACAEALAEAGTPAAEQRRARADEFVATQSWDATWQAMQTELDRAAARRQALLLSPRRSYAAVADD